MENLSFPLQRAFLALPLEGDAKRAFSELQKRLAPYEKLFRFQSPETPHLTLYFWKELMEIEYGDVLKKTEAIAARTTPFTLEVTSAETFDDRVLTLAIARSQNLSTLKKLCPWPNPCHPERSPKGGVEGRSMFHPHITLARMRNPNAFRVQKKKIMKLLKNVSFAIPCDRLRLYAEVEGVRQVPIKDFVFLIPRELS